MKNCSLEWPQFFTATIQSWQPLLKDDKYKEIIIDCLKHLVDSKQIKLIAFVIMHNHFHVIWQPLSGHDLDRIRTNFLKITAIKFKILLTSERKLDNYKASTPDRKYYFWKRDSLGIELFTATVLQQKLDYIHSNPVKAGLCEFPEQYHFSSALFYEMGCDHFMMLEHY